MYKIYLMKFLWLINLKIKIYKAALISLIKTSATFLPACLTNYNTFTQEIMDLTLDLADSVKTLEVRINKKIIMDWFEKNLNYSQNI
jgi:hypothetical protein